MNNLKELRLALGISQKILGKAVGVSDSTIRAWESGKSPSAENQSKAEEAIAALLQLKKRVGAYNGVHN
jgi:transcriptional regulator with XRE-family HTH domain